MNDNIFFQQKYKYFYLDEGKYLLVDIEKEYVAIVSNKVLDLIIDILKNNLETYDLKEVIQHAKQNISIYN